MDVGAQRDNKVADMLGHAVSDGTLEVHRNGGGGGLSADGGGVAGNLIADEPDGILVADSTGDYELDADTHQVHQDDYHKHLPENAQDGKSLARLGHVHKGAADVQGQEGDVNFRKVLKMPDVVTTIRQNQIGRNRLIKMPRMVAMTSLGRRPSLNAFLLS